MHIETYYDGIKLYRKNKIIYAQFLEPHAVISTCRLLGGLRHDLKYVFNHQSCEPAGNHCNHVLRDQQQYQKLICEPHGLPPELSAGMGTAANMNHAAFVRQKFRDLEVVAVVTGGVETNAGRAGDPATVMETEDGFERLTPTGKPPVPGTINIMLFISQPLTKAALTRTLVTATEAKTAVLQELAVNSRYSDGLATGTGTDQIVVAAPDREGFRLSWAGKHGKLGELIGSAVKAAIRETLGKQNSLTAMGQCSAKIHLERFGCNSESMLAGISQYLNVEQAELLGHNISGITRDPVTVAAVAAMAHLKDKFSWGILPQTCWTEIMTASAALLSCAVGGHYEWMEKYRLCLGESAGDLTNDGFLELCWQAIALGFSDKWLSSQDDKQEETS